MKPSIATVSLSGSLVEKLHACAAAGYDAAVPATWGEEIIARRAIALDSTYLAGHATVTVEGERPEAPIERIELLVNNQVAGTAATPRRFPARSTCSRWRPGAGRLGSGGSPAWLT